MYYGTTEYGFGHMGNFGFLYGFWHIIFIIIVVFVIIYFVNNNKNNSINSASSAIETLKQRYAKGEIDKKEFEEKKKDLM